MPEVQEPSRPGARLADKEERQRQFDLPPLRWLLPIRRGATTGAHWEYPGEGPEQRKALHLGKCAFLLFLALAALLVAWVASLWLIHSPTPAGGFWSGRLPHM
jgi:hypothetical protein